LAYPGKDVHYLDSGEVRIKREESDESAAERMKTAADASTRILADLAGRDKVKQVPARFPQTAHPSPLK